MCFMVISAMIRWRSVGAYFKCWCSQMHSPYREFKNDVVSAFHTKTVFVKFSHLQCSYQMPVRRVENVKSIWAKNCQHIVFFTHHIIVFLYSCKSVSHIDCHKFGIWPLCFALAPLMQFNFDWAHSISATTDKCAFFEGRARQRAVQLGVNITTIMYVCNVSYE